MDQGLEKLVKGKIIDANEALMSAHRPDILRGKLFRDAKTEDGKGASGAIMRQ